MHIDRNIGDSAIALADAARQAREDAQDALDVQQLAIGRDLVRDFPRIANPAMLKRLMDLGDEKTGITTEDLLAFMLAQFRLGSLGARVLMQRLWAVAKDYPELLPEDPVPLERAKFLYDYVEQLR